MRRCFVEQQRRVKLEKPPVEDVFTLSSRILQSELENKTVLLF
jgi:hypothetical protein